MNSYQTEGINSSCGQFPVSSQEPAGGSEAESIVDGARATVKIECAEFRSGHEINRLIGILDKATLTLGATIGAWISLAP